MAEDQQAMKRSLHMDRGADAETSDGSRMAHTAQDERREDSENAARPIVDQSEVDEYGVVRWRCGVLPALAKVAGLTALNVPDLRPWFRFPVNLTTGAVIMPAFDFLAADAIARGDRGRETNQARAYDLRSAFEFLALEGLAWPEIDQSVADEYAIQLACAFAADDDLHSNDGEQSPDTDFDLGNALYDDGLGLSRSTIQRRLQTLKSFYSHARANVVPFDISLALKKGRNSEVSVRPIPREDLADLLSALGPPPSRRRRGESSRLWIASMLALLAGLRRMEVCWLDAAQVAQLPFEAGAPARDYALELRVTKGGVPRGITLPGWFVAELRVYLDGERAEARPSSPALLVNSPHASRNPGGRVGPATLSHDFRCAVESVGLHRRMPGFRLGAGRTSRLHTFHDLRHTCACLFFVALRGVSSNPWVQVQSRLGHRLVRTTTDVYLKHVEQFHPHEGDQSFLQNLVRGMLQS